MAEANINLIGSEDMPSPSETWFESFDKYGLMWWHVFYQCYRMTPGTETENNPLDHNLAIACVEDMMLRYRNHPSIISWVGVNEVLMNENLYRLTKEKVKSLDTTRIYIPTTSYHWDVDALTPYLKEDLPTGTTDDVHPTITGRLPLTSSIKYVRFICRCSAMNWVCLRCRCTTVSGNLFLPRRAQPM